MTTGMSIEGRMSLFIRVADSQPKMRMRALRTAIVYGRRRASRTIHMVRVLSGHRHVEEPARAPGRARGRGERDNLPRGAPDHAATAQVAERTADHQRGECAQGQRGHGRRRAAPEEPGRERYRGSRREGDEGWWE